MAYTGDQTNGYDSSGYGGGGQPSHSYQYDHEYQSSPGYGDKYEPFQRESTVDADAGSFDGDTEGENSHAYILADNGYCYQDGDVDKKKRTDDYVRQGENVLDRRGGPKWTRQQERERVAKNTGGQVKPKCSDGKHHSKRDGKRDSKHDDERHRRRDGGRSSKRK